ncbi:hypothetical protein Fot_07365 [Forsythia ovata]|uniref:Uncharacterized protein n=1 Tax=Forsythia ovata TaxID=205694 RepID=A0ABD1WVY3_9LAMI
MEGWAPYFDKSSAEKKLNAAKALIVRSMVFIEEGALNESKKDQKPLIVKRDQLRTWRQRSSTWLSFPRGLTHEITTKALAEDNAQKESLMGRTTQLEKANAQRDGLLDKIGQLKEVAESLRSENLSLKANTEDALKAGGRQVLTEVKELYPNLDLSTIKVNYPSSKEAEDGADLPLDDGAEDSTDQPLADGA